MVRTHYTIDWDGITLRTTDAQTADKASRRGARVTATAVSE